MQSPHVRLRRGAVWIEFSAGRLRHPRQSRRMEVSGEPVEEAFSAKQVPILENQAVRLSKQGRPFWLVGLGDQWAFPARKGFVGLDDLPGALAQIGDKAPVILLAHEPDIFPSVPDRVALTICGHTHGGQIALPLLGPLYVPSRYGTRYAYGHVRENGRDLIVSAGLGMSGIPVRFGVPPEITLISTGPFRRSAAIINIPTSPHGHLCSHSCRSGLS